MILTLKKGFVNQNQTPLNNFDIVRVRETHSYIVSGFNSEPSTRYVLSDYAKTTLTKL